MTIVVAKTEGSGTGHVAVVAPEDLTPASEKWGDRVMLPVLFNVGRDNEVGPLNKFFRPSHKPKAYLLNHDKKALEAREEKHLAKTGDERQQP